MPLPSLDEADRAAALAVIERNARALIEYLGPADVPLSQP